MANRRTAMTPEMQERLRGMAAELRRLMYGEQGCPEWGTKFVKIESDGMAVGKELSRLLMEQAVDEQAAKMPADALQADEEVQGAGREATPLQTEAGVVAWDQLRGYLKGL